MVIEKKSQKLGPIILVSVMALLGAVAIIKLGPPSSVYLDGQNLNSSQEDAQSGLDPIRDSTRDKLVKQYVLAYQSKNCDEVIQLTWWIQERMAHIESQYEGNAEQIALEQSQLCEELFEHNPDQSSINILGLHDQSLMGPISTIKIIGADSGRDDLDKPVVERVWVEFVYSNPQTAPRTQNGLSSIHSLIAGVNISQDNLILKGSSRGNWEIDLTSISTKW